MNWPPDARWLWAFDSESPFAKMRRVILSEKFIKTLPAQLDKAERGWHDAQPQESDSLEYIEHEPNGSLVQRLLGGAMQLRHKFFKKNDTV